MSLYDVRKQAFVGSPFLPSFQFIPLYSSVCLESIGVVSIILVDFLPSVMVFVLFSRRVLASTDISDAKRSCKMPNCGSTNYLWSLPGTLLGMKFAFLQFHRVQMFFKLNSC